MKRIIAALLLAISSASMPALAAKPADAAPIELAANAPDRHVVVAGDTLWGIAKTFLKDPFRWNEVWQMNPEEIKNPHRIYPGQVIVLDRSGANPRLSLQGGEPGVEKLLPRVRETPRLNMAPGWASMARWRCAGTCRERHSVRKMPTTTGTGARSCSKGACAGMWCWSARASR